MLVLDTASRRVCVALIEDSKTIATRHSEDEASRSLFPSIKTLLEDRSMRLADLRSIAFCEGPGSMLGIRTAVMGIRTWLATDQLENCQILSFNSLRVGSSIVADTPDAPNSFLVVTDARRQSWNALSMAPSATGSVELIENEALEKNELPIFSLEEFPTWTRTEAKIVRLSYEAENVFVKACFPSMLKANPESELLNTRTFEFAKWIPLARTAERIEQ